MGRKRIYGHKGRPKKGERPLVEMAEPAAREKRCYPLPTPEELHRMSLMKMEDVDTSQLTNLEDIQIDPALECAEWQREWIRQTGNPYFVKIYGYPVRMAM